VALLDVLPSVPSGIGVKGPRGLGICGSDGLGVRNGVCGSDGVGVGKRGPVAFCFPFDALGVGVAADVRSSNLDRDSWVGILGTA
jgi:hypothetical protein